MYARVVINQFQPGKLEEATQILREAVLPATRQQAGFKGVLALADWSADKSITISLWQSEADAQASGAGSAYLQAQIAKATSLLAAASGIETYEISVQEMQQGRTARQARVLAATSQPDKTDELIQIVRDAILPVDRQQQGFKGKVLLTDRTTGRVIAITLWETGADLLAGESRGYLQEQLGKVAHVLATQVVREVYDVTIQA